MWVEEEYEGLSFDKLSLFDLGNEDDLTGGNHCLHGGYTTLVNDLKQQIDDIRLEHHVDCVEIDEERGVRVGVKRTMKEGESEEGGLLWFCCDYCICTLPLGVLKAGDVAFRPPLPQKINKAIENTAVGLMDKVALYYHHPFWPDNLGRLNIVSSVRGAWPWATIADSDREDGGGLLLFWIACDFAEYVEFGLETDGEILNNLMEHMRAVFPNAPFPDDYHITRWKRDPYSRGAWTTVPVRKERDTKAKYHTTVFSEELFHGRVLLAGEHVSLPNVNCVGTVTGAWFSGEYQANRVFEMWRKKEKGRKRERECD